MPRHPFVPVARGFTPHATLAYVPAGEPSPVERLDPVPTTFVALSVVVGGERRDYPLTGEVAPLIAAAPQRRMLRRASARLARLDRVLFTQALATSSADLSHVLTRAGNRIRGDMPRSHAMRRGPFPPGADRVAAELGRAYVEDELHLTEAELLARAFDGLAPQFAKWTSDATRRALSILAGETDADLDIDGEVERLAPQRDAAWAMFQGALLALAASRIYEPHPAAPPFGEFDDSLRVPAGLVREALARAGGATSVRTTAGGGLLDEDGTPLGLVAQGIDVQALFAAHGVVTSGWGWEHGDPPRPFEAHADLDGAEFDFWDDPILEVRPGDEWLGVDHYAPGDHWWCSCSFYRQLAET